MHTSAGHVTVHHKCRCRNCFLVLKIALDIFEINMFSSSTEIPITEVLEEFVHQLTDRTSDNSVQQSSDAASECTRKPQAQRTAVVEDGMKTYLTGNSKRVQNDKV